MRYSVKTKKVSKENPLEEAESDKKKRQPIIISLSNYVSTFANVCESKLNNGSKSARSTQYTHQSQAKCILVH